MILRTLLAHALAFGTILLSSCRGESVDPVRQAIPVRWDTLWVSSDQSVPPILEPEALAARGDRFFVVDVSSSTVTALEAASGRALWTSGRRGIGPGEYLTPYHLSPLANGGVAVVDQTTRRVTLLDGEGRPMGQIGLAALGGAPESACTLRNGDMLFAVFAADSFVRLDAAGARRGTVAKPFGVLDARGVVNQALLAGDSETHFCAAGLALGGGFSVLSAEGPSRVTPWIEPTPVPQWILSSAGEDSLSSDLVAALDMAIDADTLWSLFEGKTTLQRRQLDAYALPVARYVGSLALPARASRFAKVGDLFLLKVGRPDGTFHLLALRRHPS